MEQISELHPIAKTPLYVVYPTLKPLRNALSWLPWMAYEELDEEHEMNDLLDGNAERQVTINGKLIMKKHINKVKKHMKQDANKEDPLA